MNDDTSSSGKGRGVIALVLLPLLVVALFVIGMSGEKKKQDANCLPDVPRLTTAPGTVVMPLAEGTYQKSSPFGPRDGGFHRGEDLAAPLGTPIYAATDGTVADAGPAAGFGHWIVLDTGTGTTKLSTVYGHMFADGLLVHKGDHVTAGQVIGKVGGDGESSGPHLHFEVWPGGRLPDGAGTAIDPEPWLAKAHAPTPAPTSSNILVDSPSGAAVAPASGGVSLAANTRPAGVGCGLPVGGDGLKPGSVPAAFAPWITTAAGTCPEVTAPLIAAQIENESGFNVNAHNAESGADGPTQFIPGTWAAKAVDGDGDGHKDTRSIPDAVMTQAAYDCELAGIAKQGLSHGKLHGDLTELWLSMYNCGPGATLSGGQPCQNAQTAAYVKNIPHRAAAIFSAPNPRAAIGTVPGGGGPAVAAALRWLGTTYVWGGGDASGPTRGQSGEVSGFDCSGLVLYAVAVASGGRIVMPHQTVAQLNDPRGQTIPLGSIQPGDAVFPAGDNPGHVAIYVGDGNVVHAPDFGDVVKVSPMNAAVGADPSVRRFR